MITALVIGEDTRSFLSVIRSLGNMGMLVDVVCFDNTSPALRSKFINKAHYYNYQNSTETQWIDSVKALIKLKGYDLVFPCDERAIYPLIRCKDDFDNKTRLALPNKEVRESLFDKHLTKKIANKRGIRVAKGDMHSLENINYDALAQRYTTKFVIKPTESFCENNLSSRNKVAIIENAEEFATYLEKSEVVGNDFLVEEYFEGVGEGISLFACKGEVQYMLAHSRVNEPRSGGGSSYRKAIPVEASMANACKAICEETIYDGVGMFEFKRNHKTNEWILVEVNARFWGSLPLAIHAGIDFPKHYAKYLLGDFRPLPSPCIQYNEGTLARSFSNDMYDIRAEMQHISLTHGKLKSIIETIKRLSSYIRVLGDEKIDSYERDDPQPFYEEFKQLFDSTILKKAANKLPIKHNPEKLREILRLMYLLEGKGRIIFVCYGNIMRSPLAAEFANIFIQNTKLNFSVDSFGFHTNESRPSPGGCQQVAASLGIDLSEHKSKRLLQSHLKDDDIVFIFDEHNEEKLNRFYEVENVFNLADFIPPGLGKYRAIDDPYGHGDEAVRRCYVLIIEALKTIFESYLSLK